MNEIQRLLAAFLAGMVAIGLLAAYYVIAGPGTLLTRTDNPRLVEQRAAIQRGTLYDRNGEVLAETINDEGRTVRRYPHLSTYSALGYYSLRYGAGGAEAAYDPRLSGADRSADLAHYFEEDILHRPTRGTDLRLTFDLTIQQQIAEALAGTRGAAAMIAVPDGDILALVSLPTYNPNTLDADWDQLVASPQQPFFNRALQGRYQPGGTIYTPLLIGAMLEGVPLSTTYEGATAAVTTGSVTLNCLETPPQTTLTLEQAYVYGCPAPFAQFIESAGVDAVAEVLELFHFDDPVTLPGFANDVPPRPEATAQPSPTAAPTADDEPLRRADALGQGELTVSPLHMAAVTAAVVNGGNAPQPRALLQIKPPGDDWTPVQERQPSLPITTVQNARQMQNIMRQSVQQGTAQAANREGYAIGGQVALAYSGESTQAWFVGWALTGAQRGVAVAIVLEDSDDLARAAHIGGTALKAAVDTLPIAIGTN